MKVIVNVCYGGKVKSGEGDTRLSMVVKPSDTILRLKQRVKLVEPVPFPEQDLQLEGASLEDHKRIEELGLQEGQVLHFNVIATVAVFKEQLVNLLKAQRRAIPVPELAMLYSHKHGTTVKRALGILGCSANLSEFIAHEKQFLLEESGLVRLQETANEVEERSIAISARVVVKSTLGNVVTAALELKAKTSDTLQSITDRVAAAELIPFQVTKVTRGGQALQGSGEQLGSFGLREDVSLDVEVTISKDMLVQQLAGLLNGRSLSVIELGDLYCYRYGVPVSRALELLGRRSTLKEFLKDNAEHFSMQAGCVMQKETSNNDTARETSLGGLNQRYLDLDAEITNCKSVEETESALELAIKSAREGGLLNVNRVIRGGSLGRGTAFSGNVDAEALLLVNGQAIGETFSGRRRTAC